MTPYAVIETGGKQYRVQPGQTLKVERLPADAGEDLALDSVLAVSDGKTLKVGTPHVEGATVTCTVREHTRAKKVVSFKKNRRKGYSRKKGHRQDQTVLEVKDI